MTKFQAEEAITIASCSIDLGDALRAHMREDKPTRVDKDMARRDGLRRQPYWSSPAVCTDCLPPGPRL
jgi:hypothetical protein